MFNELINTTIIKLMTIKFWIRIIILIELTKSVGNWLHHI